MGRQALRPPGDAWPDWTIIQEIARRVGLDWNYEHPRDVFAEMRLAMPSLQGITWDRLEREGAVTYPCDSEDQPGHEIIFGDGFPTPTGRGKLVPADVLPPDEMPDDAYPMILTTGRLLEHWHTGAMTRRASVLDAIEPEAVAPPCASRPEAPGRRPRRICSRRHPPRHDRARRPRRPRRSPRTRLHPVLLRRGRRERPYQPRARPLRQDSRVQVLCGAGGTWGEWCERSIVTLPPARAMNEASGLPVAASATLVRRSWRRRSFLVRLLNAEYTVDYTNWKGGCVSIFLENSLRNGVRHQVHRYLGDFGDPYLWPLPQVRNSENQQYRFVPQIRFTLESLPARVDVRVWPWYAVRGLSFRVGGMVLYAEGSFTGSVDPSAYGDVWDREMDG